jgi:hypothetical protein
MSKIRRDSVYAVPCSGCFFDFHMENVRVHGCVLTGSFKRGVQWWNPGHGLGTNPG